MEFRSVAGYVIERQRLARAILARAREFGVDVESPTVLSYAAK